MNRSSTQDLSPSSVPARRYGPAVGEPPVWVDPRRWGSLIGLVGGMVFITSYSSVLGHTISTITGVAGLGLFGAALFFHYVRPVALGPLSRPGPARIAIYVACVFGELALINLGSRALMNAGHIELRPALIAAVVGVHFIPFAWAFGERMFLWLGTLVATCGVIGLVAGGLGVAHAADAMAVIAGLTMMLLIISYAQGRFAPAAAVKRH